MNACMNEIEIEIEIEIDIDFARDCLITVTLCEVSCLAQRGCVSFAFNVLAL